MGEVIPDVSARIAEHAVDTWEESAGRVTVRRVRPGRFGRAVLRLLRMAPDVVVHLDPLGSAAWLLMDGKRTVADIRRELQARYPEESELPRRLGRFLGAMVSRGFVRLS